MYLALKSLWLCGSNGSTEKKYQNLIVCRRNNCMQFIIVCEKRVSLKSDIPAVGVWASRSAQAPS